MRYAWLLVASAVPVGVAGAQSIEVRVSDEVIDVGESYTVEVWANSDGNIEPGPNGLAFAGFLLDVRIENGVADLTEGDVSAVNQSLVFGSSVVDRGGGVWSLVGGQVADIFGWGPRADRSDPILLFSFSVSGAGAGVSGISVGRAEGRDFALAWYPDSQSGASVMFSDSTGSATVTVVPGPGAGLVLGALLGGWRRRR